MGYITQISIAQDGDFGDQMLKYASLYSIGKKTGLTPVFIKEYLDIRHGFPLGIPFKKEIPIISLNDNSNLEFYEITTEGIFDDRVFNLTSDKNYNFVGAGNWKYFHDIEKEIQNLFEFKSDITSFCKNFISENSQPEETLVSLHFRRGSYLIDASLNLSLNYYYKAIEHLKSQFPNNKFKFLAFSNDIEWVENNLKIDNCIYVKNSMDNDSFLSQINNLHHRSHMNTSGDRYKDMCLMSMCDHNIIANSCFSLMGAYLNSNSKKAVICPYNWAHEGFMLNGKYYPENWIPLKTY